jgi:uncharacterized protein
MERFDMRKYDLALREMRNPHPHMNNVLQLLRDSIGTGDHRAEYALATWYLHGTHLRKDYRQAAELLQRSAAKGNRNAMYDLAVSYEKGRGLKRNTKKAFNLYISAAWLGDKQACYEVGRMLYHGLGAARDRQLARIWLDRAKKYGVH